MANEKKVKTGIVLEAEVKLPNKPINRALIIDGTGELKESSVTDSELANISGVTSNVQTQLDAKTGNSDTDVSTNGWVLDEDTMSSDDATKVPTQQSVKAYVDAEVAAAVASEMSYEGSYDASTVGPNSSAAKGDVHTVTVAGTGGGYWSTALEIGDLIISEIINPTTEADWTVVSKDLDAASIKTLYESNANTEGYTTAEQTKVGHITVTQAVNLDTMESDIATNNAKVSADGSVTTHSDVTNAGSGAIITSGERTTLGTALQPGDASTQLNHTQATESNWTIGTTASVGAHLDEVGSRLNTVETAADLDENVKISSNDTTAGYLEDKIVASSGANTTNPIEITTLNDGADEDVQIQFDVAKVDHDSTLNHVANEHIDHTSVDITTAADSGLSGGGDISASRTIVVDINGTTADAVADDTDKILIQESGGARKSMTRADFLSGVGAGSAGDIAETSFSGATDVATSELITNFNFLNGVVRSFKAHVSVVVVGTATTYETFELEGIQKGATWDMSVTGTGDDSLVIFTVGNNGQIFYSKATTGGWVSTTIKFRAITLSI